MIYWTWLIAAFVTGGTVGLIVAALCAAAGRADNRLGMKDGSHE